MNTDAILQVCPGLAVLLVVLGISLVVVVVAAAANTVHDQIREGRERQNRIARQQVVQHAEQQLRDSTQATMRAMREAIRRHNGQG